MARAPVLVATIAAIAAVGGVWYYHDRTKLNGLQCTVDGTETQYSSNGAKTVEIKPQTMWIVELLNNQWRWV
jgi:hypothetical protein